MIGLGWLSKTSIAVFTMGRSLRVTLRSFGLSNRLAHHEATSVGRRVPCFPCVL